MPLKPFRVTANLPGEIEELVSTRVHEEKYPSTSAYIAGLVLFDIYCRRKHLLTGELMREPQWLRDQIISEIVRDFDSKEKRPGGWFEHRIQELITQRKESGEARAS